LSNSKWNIKNPALIFCAKCNNVTISNIDLKNSEAIYGIYFFNTTNSTISNISVLYNKLPAVYMYQGGRNSITNLNGSYNGDDTREWVEAGIVLDSSNSNYIFNASLSGYPNGIFGYYSTNNTIAKSILRNSEKEGIYLEKSNYTNITESILENNAYDGIVLLYTTRTNFSKNTVRNNTDNGILLSYGGFGDFIFNNTVTNSSAGINIDQSTESDKILSNTVENNSYYGIKTGYSSSNLEISDNRVCNSSSWDFYCNYWPGANKFSNNRCYFNRIYNCNQTCLAC
jgi:parallel beta-helix repeat protein